MLDFKHHIFKYSRPLTIGRSISRQSVIFNMDSEDTTVKVSRMRGRLATLFYEICFTDISCKESRLTNLQLPCAQIQFLPINTCQLAIRRAVDRG